MSIFIGFVAKHAANMLQFSPGEGPMSIRQREWTTPNGKKRSAWVVDYLDAKGKRRNKQFRTKKAADDWRSETKVDLRQGTHVADRDGTTVSEAGKLWIAGCVEDELEPATVERYQQILRLHIEPDLGAKRLHEVDVAVLGDFRSRLRAAGKSTTLIKKVITVLGGLFTDAQGRKLVKHNPAHVHVRSKRRRRKAAEGSRKRLVVGVDIPTPEEIRALVNAASGFRRAFFATAALSGLRTSELRGLPWRDVDLIACTITVSQRADKFGNIGDPKSESGNRTIPVPALVINALKEWKLASPKGDLGLVFPSSDGGVEHYRHIQRDHWHPLQIAAGVAVDGQAKYSGLHALRHFFCSWCANNREAGGLGLTPKETQIRMGHGTLALTTDLYGHLFPSQDDAKVLAAGERALMGA
jgi:integrase